MGLVAEVPSLPADYLQRKRRASRFVVKVILSRSDSYSSNKPACRFPCFRSSINFPKRAAAIWQ
jgi:hypothetical protein